MSLYVRTTLNKVVKINFREELRYTTAARVPPLSLRLHYCFHGSRQATPRSAFYLQIAGDRRGSNPRPSEPQVGNRGSRSRCEERPGLEKWSDENGLQCDCSMVRLKAKDVWRPLLHLAAQPSRVARVLFPETALQVMILLGDDRTLHHRQHRRERALHLAALRLRGPRHLRDRSQGQDTGAQVVVRCTGISA
jgi:hypothetical protein